MKWRKNMVRIWHISDTHGHHSQLIPPLNIDIVIHSGDASNFKDPYRNEAEMHSFLTWFSKLPIKHKVFVAGNHDTSVEKTLIHEEDMKNLGITYLYMNSVEILGYKIWGSPYCPRYGDWAFMKSRHNMMEKVWQFMDPTADIVVTHTPPKGILDYSDYRMLDAQKGRNITVLEACGCLSLKKKILEIKPYLHCFGHIHSSRDTENAGTKTIPGLKTIFSNGASCMDGSKDRMTFNGNIIELPSKVKNLDYIYYEPSKNDQDFESDSDEPWSE